MIFTNSVFYFGHTVTGDNNSLPFDEGSGEIVAEIAVGSYSLTSFLEAVAKAMNAVSSGNNYSLSVDRDTRQITITGNNPFDILSNSSLLINVSIFDLLGFDTSTDKVGLSSYTGENASGKEYLPQFKLQEYVDFEDDQRSASASVNESASGLVEVISYGNVKTMSCNIILANNYPQGKASPITENLNGVNDLREFMEYATKKGDIEFMPDINDRATGQICLLESTNENPNGTAFKLKEQFRRGLVGYFETGLIKFRKVSDL
jgi:hypothetical protein